MQIARELGAGRVIATVRSRDTDDLLARLGATAVVDASAGNLAEAMREAADVGVDIVVDHVGASYLAANLSAMAVRGRLVSVGRLGGARAELDLETLALKRLELIGVTFRTRSVEEKRAIAQKMRRDLDGALNSGKLDPVIASTHDWTEAEAVQDRLTEPGRVGKMVLTLS